MDSPKKMSFSKLRTLSSLINSAEDLNTLLDLIMKSAKELLDCEGASLLLLDEKTKTLKFHIVLGGNNDNEIIHESFPLGVGIAGKVAETGESIISNQAQDDKRLYQKMDDLTNITTSSLLCVPMKVRDKVIGVLEVINSNQGQFEKQDRDLLEFLANNASIAIHNRLLFSHLNKANAELKKRVNELKYLNELSITSHIDQETTTLFSSILKNLSKLLNVTSAVLYIHTPKENYLRAVWAIDNGVCVKNPKNININEGLEGFVFQNKETLLTSSNNTKNHPAAASLCQENKNCLAVPIIVERTCIGIIKMTKKENNRLFTSSDLQVVANVASYIAKVYRNHRLSKEKTKQSRIKKEIEIASILQNSFLPQNIPSIIKLNIAIFNEHSQLSNIEGHFYDIIQIDNDKIAIAICQVVGKGVPAALSMALFKNALRGQIKRNPSPKFVFDQLNQQFCHDATSEEGIQSLYLLIDTHNKVITYSASGLGIQFNLYRINKKKSNIQKRQSQSLGLNPHIEYSEYMIPYDDNDLLLAWSKGKDSPSSLSEDLENIIWQSEELSAEEISNKFKQFFTKNKSTNDPLRFSTFLFMRAKE